MSYFTGSNSVNVFLGLGLPWVISTCYHAVKKTKYIVYSGNLTFSVVIFSSFGLVCILTLVIRRWVSSLAKKWFIRPILFVNISCLKLKGLNPGVIS